MNMGRFRLEKQTSLLPNRSSSLVMPDKSKTNSLGPTLDTRNELGWGPVIDRWHSLKLEFNLELI